MNRPDTRHLLDVLVILSHSADFSVGCYCEDEGRCHRSILRELFAERQAASGTAWQFMGRFDTALMGRRSYQAALAMPGGGAMPGIATYVFSRTLRPEVHPNVTIVRENVSEALASLRQAPGKEIWLFGGGDLFRSLLQLGKVDMVEVGLVPALLGRGIPFLPELDRQVRLRLVESRPYPTGITLLTYEVLKDATKAPPVRPLRRASHL